MIDGAVNVLTDNISISRIGVPWLHSAEQRPQRHHPQLPLLELHAPPAAAAPARRETLAGRNRPGATGAGHQGQRAGLSLPEIGRGSQDAEGIGGSQRVRGGTAGVGGAGAGVREDSKCHDSPKGQGNF